MQPKVTPGTKIAVRIPNALGDAVMATPLLERLSAAVGGGLLLVGPLAALDVLRGGPWDAGKTIGLDRKLRRGIKAHFRLAELIRKEAPEIAVCLPNSIGALLPFWLAKVPYRIGYAKEGRSFMLTGSIRRDIGPDGRFLPSYTGGAFLRLSDLLEGLPQLPAHPKLYLTDSGQQVAEEWRASSGLKPGQRYFIIVPGAAFGPAKIWLPERYAQVADTLIRETGMAAFISAGPGEEAVAEAVSSAMQESPLPVGKLGLQGLKAVFAGASLVVGNDTGPRHIAVGFDVPVITVMGSVDPRYSRAATERGKVVRVDVPCNPCQLKVCPLVERICMTEISSEMVLTECRKWTTAGTS